MRWAWNPAKAVANLEKHGISFETAVLVFDDPMQTSSPDPHLDEDRWRTIGRVNASTLFVVHTQIDEGGDGRIISARKATPSERRLYEQTYFQS